MGITAPDARAIAALPLDPLAGQVTLKRREQQRERPVLWGLCCHKRSLHETPGGAWDDLAQRNATGNGTAKMWIHFFFRETIRPKLFKLGGCFWGRILICYFVFLMCGHPDHVDVTWKSALLDLASLTFNSSHSLQNPHIY